jgi:hypothetical protein
VPPKPKPAVPPKGKKADVKDVFTALSTPAQVRADYSQIGVTLPKAHLRVLDAESALYGLRRSQFLELLFLNALGQASLVRVPVAPSYTLSREELTQTDRFLWYIRTEVKKLLEEYLVQRGVKPSTWVVGALNEWAGLTRDPK